MIENKEELNFYYNRERRLENAPQSVKDLYKDSPAPRFGLFNSLIADKPRRILFFVIIVLCVLVFALSRMEFFDDVYTLDGNKIEITGITLEDSTIVILNKKDADANSYTGALNIAVSIPAEDEELMDEMPVFYHRVFFNLVRDEEFRFVVPFNAPELLAVLQSEKSTLQLTFKPN